MPNVLYFYRVLHWRDKVGWLRVAAYPLFGYVLSGGFEKSYVYHFFVIISLTTYSYTINNYIDWTRHKEKNYLELTNRSFGWSKRKILLVAHLPLILQPLILFVGDKNILAMHAFMLLLVYGYSLPPFRFKERRFWGVVTPTLIVLTVFLQAVTLGGLSTAYVLVFFFLLACFQLYAETLHMIDDASQETEVIKLSMPNVVRLKTIVLTTYIAVSIIATALVNVVFVISSLAGTTRLIVNRKLSADPSNIKKIRKDLLVPQWMIVEFCIYVLLGITGYFAV